VPANPRSKKPNQFSDFAKVQPLSRRKSLDAPAPIAVRIPVFVVEPQVNDKGMFALAHGLKDTVRAFPARSGTPAEQRGPGSGTLWERRLGIVASMMKRALLALTLSAGLSIGNASAQTTTDPAQMAEINAQIHQAIAQVSPAASCRESRTLRFGMYAAQVINTLATGAAVQHGAVGRTPFGTTNAPTALVTQAAFDAIVGMLTRRGSCKTKDLVDVAIGGSALFNTLKAGSQP